MSKRDGGEAERLAALESLEAAQPDTDHVLQEIVDSVRDAFGVDLCLANLVFSETLYFRAWSGELPGDLAGTRRMSRDDAPCRYVVEGDRPLVVEDFHASESLGEETVCADYGIRFYAGAPLGRVWWIRKQAKLPRRQQLPRPGSCMPSFRSGWLQPSTP